MTHGFSFRRLNGVMRKELVQMRRDRLTFAMMLAVPLLQLVLFGFAINTDPKGLPTALHVLDPSPFSRDLAAAMANAGYFALIDPPTSEAEVDRMLDRGKVQFVVTIPANFARDLIRGRKPSLLLDVDATDPAAASNAVAAFRQLTETAFSPHLTGPFADLAPGEPPVNTVIHMRYNPDGESQYNTVPGLLGVVLTMTMVMMTALSITRERERGTLENLLSMPLRPVEMMVGKILPYVGVGYVQVVVVLVMAKLLFGVPMVGSPLLLSVLVILFIACNLAVGMTFSALARNQLQAMQMSFFFFLPSILLSGFMFPFRGQPEWAQVIGSIFPLTHFLRLVRGILLKGNGLVDVLPFLWPQALFLLGAFLVALLVFRETLD
ncbi:MAG: ABC transporter permease [Rhodospirillum sp.]|nr:ABC transporter permease [Rhodospirillum sp.]MCF8488816.1 ABC transporter permease [Rhodospirillum sp.]MCF8500898.1 ABC transporter permease [Rhodospirillum sp.]